MAIQMRRGQFVDFDPTQLLPGEFAVSQDNSRVFLCTRAGVVIELGTLEQAIQFLEEMRVYHDEALTYAGLSQSYAIGTNGSIRPDDNTDNSKYYYLGAKDIKQYIDDIVDGDVPAFTIDFTTGHIMYDKTIHYVYISQTTGHLMWTLA